jgi:hypothetical protein
MGKNMEGGDLIRLEVAVTIFVGETKENYENVTNYSRKSGEDTNQISPEYKSETLQRL